MRMELGLSLGDASKPFTFGKRSHEISNKGLGFCMGLGFGSEKREEGRVSTDPPLPLDLLPLSPVPRNLSSSQMGFSWPSENGKSEGGSSGRFPAKRFDVNRLPSTEEIDDGAAVSSPNSTVSSFQMERTSSRASDEEENGLVRKKLRLSKDQSAFLEESFKEHNTLNPKQKLALAKQLNLRPRQVEVWFQNRRARTKLKQTEVDCEYLKRCCETLTEENRRLQKELQELRALKTSHPFNTQVPATTLTMCPSCERVATTSSPGASATTTTTTTEPKARTFSLSKPRLYSFSHGAS